MNPQSTQVDPTALALSRAIRTVESGGNYNAQGASGEKGAYQWMPGNFENSAKEQGLDPSDFSEANQDHVAYNHIKSLLDKGYSQSQIASIWNSGQPHWEGKVGVNSHGVKYDVPAYVDAVKNAYGQSATVAPATKPQAGGPDASGQMAPPGMTGPSINTYQFSGRQGDPGPGGVMGFLGNVAKSIAEPVATTIARPIQAGAELLGASAEDVNKASSQVPFGLVAPVPQSGSDVVKDVGRGIQTAALGIPVSGFAGAAGLGAAQGLGASIEQQGSNTFTPSGAVNAAINTGVGGLAGAGTFGALKGVGGAVQGAGNLFSGKTAKAAEEGIRDAYGTALNLNQSERAFEQRSGRDLADVLMKNKAPLGRYEDGTLDTSGAVAKLQTALDPLNAQVEEMLNKPQGVVRPVSLDEVLQGVEKRINDSNIPASEAKGMIKTARQTLADEMEKYGGEVPPNISDTIKRAFQKSVFTKAITPEGKLVNNVNYIISDELNSATEKALQGTDTDASYKALNAQRSELVDAIKRLVSKDGVKLVRGGRVGNMAGGIVGSIVGHATGGGPGAVLLGDWFGTEAAKFLNDPATRVGAATAKHSILNRIPVSKTIGGAIGGVGGLVKRAAPLGARAGYAAASSVVGR